MATEDLAIVRRVVARLSFSGNPADRDNLISDGAVALMEGVDVWDSRPDVRRRFAERDHFVSLVIRRRVIDGMRKRNGRRRHGLHRQQFERGMLRLDGEERETHDAPQVGLMDPALADVEVAELLDRLPDREREIVRRSVLESETCTSVAADLGVSLTRVCQIRDRGLDRLRKEFA